MGNKVKFLKEAVCHFWQIGAVTSSSPVLIGALLADIDFAQATRIVEFGAGCGGVTREILRRMRPDARLISFELNKVFFEEISSSIKDARFEPVHANVTSAGEFCEFGTADCVVSGLPMGNFGPALKTKILDTATGLLKPGGRYSQFQYSPIDYLRLRRCFGAVRLRFAVTKVPRPWFYRCLIASCGGGFRY